MQLILPCPRSVWRQCLWRQTCGYFGHEATTSWYILRECRSGSERAFFSFPHHVPSIRHPLLSVYCLCFFIYILLSCLGDSSCFNQGLTRSNFFLNVLEIFLQILIIFSPSILVARQSHSLFLSTHSLIGCIPYNS